MNIKSRSVQKAFTLIELLIVIAIIGILMVAFLPTLRGGQASARNAARKAGANNIILAIERITNGDIPAGVTLPAGVTAGTIPAVAGSGVCLDFTSGIGKAVRDVLGNTPQVYSNNTTTLCSGGFFYKSFLSTAAVTTAATDTAVNYLVAVQVELPVNNGNYSGTAIAPMGTVEVNTALDTWSNTLNKTTGAATTALWVVTK